ncbi:hypothetical protein QN400_24590 [Pseudomonas sp. RTC3]|uniref:hypothetical protein n=1 Tax=Pseudomonas sp. 5C2 TaxID=3048588 RepID=UPI002AB463A4|nr:hypothetical protein [Pseudomonas sp. 5C2]MDY7566835.1 hypothetical protein [Pseudomonas sp. 5C2]MEB0065182.1 hypothetical protein [Pseudomonas sp. RTC3]MEB0243849.1 hypothetical protein [Pseudomonas sp. 5C2]
MTQKIRVFCLVFAPWRFAVVAVSAFVFALTAGGAWFPMATVGSRTLDMLFSAQVVSFELLVGATIFLYVGVRNGQPAWRHKVVFFNAAILGSYVGNELLPLLVGGGW